MSRRQVAKSRLKDVDQSAGRAVRSAKEGVKDRVQEARHRRELRSSDVSLSDRLRNELRRRRSGDVEPGSQAAEEMQDQQSVVERVVSGARALAAGASTEQQQRQRQRQQSDETVERARQASHVSPPTDHSLIPVEDRGMGTMQSFVTGERRSEGMMRYEQQKSTQTEMQWAGQHRAGAITVITAQKRPEGSWTISAQEQSPAGRANGQTLVAENIPTREAARERALDWMRDNPDGIPFHEQASQYGAAGFASGNGLLSQEIDDGFVSGGGESIVTDDDLDGVLGGGL